MNEEDRPQCLREKAIPKTAAIIEISERRGRIKQIRKKKLL